MTRANQLKILARETVEEESKLSELIEALVKELGEEEPTKQLERVKVLEKEELATESEEEHQAKAQE